MIQGQRPLRVRFARICMGFMPVIVTIELNNLSHNAGSPREWKSS